MDEFDNLENNVVRAIELIKTLSIKNENLQKEKSFLMGKIAEHKQLIQQLQEDNQKLADNPGIIHFDKEKENKIRNKIQHIIEKLDNFEKLSNNQ